MIETKKSKELRLKLDDMQKDLCPESRRIHIVHCLGTQRKRVRVKAGKRDNMTLIDLSRGTIEGSGICGHCNGWLGRQD